MTGEELLVGLEEKWLEKFRCSISLRRDLGYEIDRLIGEKEELRSRVLDAVNGVDKKNVRG